ncbi:hypothetical protein CPC08DRAFT_22231 [Agrocybe pediades]|nr:hypothetical protein CPC08DRAFT_22231 [Agrocybe pediades]
MSVAAPPTSLTVPRLGDDDSESNVDFRDFLQSLIHDYLESKSSRKEDPKSWSTVIDQLTNHLLGPFPLPDITPWAPMSEKISVTESTLEVIRRAFLRVEGIYDVSGDLLRKLFVRLLDLLRVLDIWTQVEVKCDKDTFTPLYMKEKTITTLGSILRGLGNDNPMASVKDGPCWKILKGILQELVDTCNDLLVHPSQPTDTIIIAIFGHPKILPVKDQDVLEQGTAFDALKVSISATRLTSFIVLAVEVLLSVLSPPLRCQWHLVDVARPTAEIARGVLLHALNPANPATTATRSQNLVNILSATKPWLSLPEYQPILGDLLEYCFKIRLDSALNLDWSNVDSFLLKSFQEQSGPMSFALIHSVLHRLKAREFDTIDQEDLLWAYLQGIARSVDQCIVPMLTQAVESLYNCPQRFALLQQLRDIATTSARMPDTKEASNAGRLVMSSRIWRQKVQEVVQEIIAPEPLSWMDDDVTCAPDICKRALFEVRSRFERAPGTGSLDKLSVATKLSDLPCLLAYCDKSNCFTQRTHNTILEVGAYTPLLHALLDDSKQNTTPDIRRRVYSALEFILKHHSGQEDLQPVVNLLFVGMRDPDRSVKISSGRALAGLVQLYGTAGEEGFKRTDAIFARLYQFFEQSKNPVREALVVTVSSMAKTENTEVLGQVLCLLVAQLGRPNPVIKASAFTKILSIAKERQKAPYALILPYFDQLAPYIARQLTLQPDLLGEACRVLSITPPDFLNITATRTLPVVYASCDLNALNVIAQQMSKPPSHLLVTYAHSILAHILLLPEDAMKKAVKFVLKVVNDVSSSPIDMQSLVRSCLVPLLAQLVVVLGHENKERAGDGLLALRRVERILSVQKNGSSGQSDLAAFLKNYILGVISNVNDMLQGVHGKKTVIEKRRILRSLGGFVQLIGTMINNIAPQIMATFQTMVHVPELAEATLESWTHFLSALSAAELGQQLGPTSAAIVTAWPTLTPRAREMAFETLQYVICTMGSNLDKYLAEIVDLSTVEELRPLYQRLQELRQDPSPGVVLQRILDQIASDNVSVAVQALRELKTFMAQDHKDYMRKLTSGDMFDNKIGQILLAMLTTACRENVDGTEDLRLLAFECLGVLGAIDPDRCEIPYQNTGMVVMKNFLHEGEAMAFALHLIQDLLVGAFRSTSDIKHQGHLAYSIQELLKFCQFTPALVTSGSTTSVPLKVRHRWNALPKHVLETVTPLLEGRFTIKPHPGPELQHPIYPTQSTYREWLQLWTHHLISKASGPTAAKIFGVFRSAIRNKDVVVARHLLPHLVLNILISGNEDDASAIREEMLSVLEDQVNLDSPSTSDKKLLSAQAVFMLLDHLNKWARLVRQEMGTKKADNKRSREDRNNLHFDEQLTRLDSILASIDQTLMAKAAFQCKAYARALMNYEQQIVVMQERGVNQTQFPAYYEKLHEIYANLDEPDGMEGISSLILAPTLEHQIRQHESTGRWTSAQSCWEVRLQESPDNVEFHVGLLRCLRNLGHYDTLRTHVIGVLTRHPEWESNFSSFQVESAWMVGDWADVQKLVDRVESDTPPMVIARVLLAMRTGDNERIQDALSHARSVLGSPITAAGIKGYRRSYEAVLNLHMTHELELIHQITSTFNPDSQYTQSQGRLRTMADLSKEFADRLNITYPTFRTREPLLSMRRTAFILSENDRLKLNREIGQSWLASAKIARKARQWQTAYSAMLQADQRNVPYSFIDSAKLLKASGEPLRALTELENSARLHGFLDNQVVDLTEDAETQKMKAKILVLRARWMNDLDRYDAKYIYNIFREAADLQNKWENAYFYMGHFHDEVFKGLAPDEIYSRGLKMNYHTVKAFAEAIMHGSKFIYQTIPRMLTLWLDLAQDQHVINQNEFKKTTACMATAIKAAPVYKWFTAFPQIVSRVTHDNVEVYKHLKTLILRVIDAYPNQALWLFVSAVKSNKSNRSNRGRDILNQIMNNPHNRGKRVASLVNESIAMADELLALCNKPVDQGKMTFSMSKDFPQLRRLGRSNVIIPLQESLTANLPPPNSSEDSVHEPFPLDAPTFQEFADEIEIMKSLAKPRKITILGSNGQTYMFLGKPKDDLRKDARLMDFNAIINKLLKSNSESRRRQLHIRTYGVVTLNEECGFIQWVPNTIPIRPVLAKYYETKRLPLWSPKLAQICSKITAHETDQAKVATFQNEVLTLYKPVLHEWFAETFPEPSAWLASRLTYGRTLSVMSMVGFILGLGDRHLENILLDTATGDVIHVDFNCLFERGKTLETPERVPFRLTQNIVGGLGVTGVEGVFRIACEVTLQLLRDNKDTLMSVLDAFVHDPLVEWEDEKRKIERDIKKAERAEMAAGKKPTKRPPIDTRAIANNKERRERVLSTSNLVEILIQEASDLCNLVKMYPGWASWH